MNDTYTKDIHFILQELRLSIENIREITECILADVNKGYVPDKDTITRFNTEIDGLRSYSDSIRTRATGILGQEEQSPDVSVIQLAEAIIEKQEKRKADEMRSVRMVLDHFSSVKAHIELYSQALLPFQENAAEMLKAMNCQKYDLSENANHISDYRLFLDCLSMENFESDEGIHALDELSSRFSNRVQLGIARNQYFLPEIQEKTASVPSREIDSDICSSATEDAPVPLIVTEMYAAPDSVDSSPECVSGVFLEQSPKIQENDAVVYSINSVKKASPSASIFKKDLRKNTKEVSVIIPLLTNLGTLTCRQIYDFGAIMDAFGSGKSTREDVGNCLNKLTSNNGLLSSFIIENGDTVYCLTRYTYGCIGKDSVKRSGYFQLSVGKFAIVADDEADRNQLSDIIRYNDLLLSYFSSIRNSVSTKEFTEIRSSLRMTDGFYRILVITGNRRFDCVLHNPGNLSAENANLLVVGDEIPKEYAETFENVLYCKEGRIFAPSVYDGEFTEEKLEASPVSGEPNWEQPDHDKTSASVSEPEEIRAERTVADPEEHPSTTETKQDKEPHTPLSDDENKDATDKPDTGAENCVSAEFAPHTANISERKSLTSPIAYFVPEPQRRIISPDSDNPLKVLSETTFIPCDEDFLLVIDGIICGDLHSRNINSDIMRAVMLAKTASFDNRNTGCSQLADRLVLATRFPLWSIPYNSETITEILSDCSDECLILAVYIQALLIPESAHDYTLYQASEYNIKHFDELFPSLEMVKSFYNKMLEIHKIIPASLKATGFSAPVMSLLGDATEQKKFAETLQRRAIDLQSTPKAKIRIRALPSLYNKCFGQNSDLFYCMTIIGNNDQENSDFVELTLSKYCDESDGEMHISEQLIEEELDREWLALNQKNSFELAYDARAQALRFYSIRLEVMKEWVEYVQTYGGKHDIKRIGQLRNEIKELADASIKALIGVSAEYVRVLIYSIEYVYNYLSNPGSVTDVFSEFAYSGVFSLDDSYLPHVDSSMNAIKYYEPWRNLIRHILSPVASHEEAVALINDDTHSDIFDNLRQLSMLYRMKDGEEYALSDQQIKEARDNAEARNRRFMEQLELSYTYDRISETEKERFAAIANQNRRLFYETMDFGRWKQFLRALKSQMQELISAKKQELRRELEARKASLGQDKTSSILDEAEQLLEEAENFAVAEEYLNRFDNGERDFSEDYKAANNEKDSFEEFLSDKVFYPIQDCCLKNNGKTLRSFAWSKYLESHIPSGWTARQKDDSKKLIESWPLRKGVSTTYNIKDLFTCLGFTILDVKRNTGTREESYIIHAKPTAKSMADYRHPISIFGTQIKSQINVVVLFGNYAPKQLVDTITALDFGGMSIVLVDRPIDRVARRQIAEIFHTQTSGQNPFLLIDQILIMYLALHQITERLPILLRCTLPYTSYQPFVRDGGVTADEMFFGRTKELATIIDTNGACIVYGGRQLGKTALLKRAESRCSKPEKKQYAVYCNIIYCDSEQKLVDKIVEEFGKKTDLPISLCGSLKELCIQLYSLFRSGNVERLHLLLDEADNFLKSIAPERYASIQPFIELRTDTKNNFKFVLAGLHNVCRAKNATADNGGFGQFGTPLCIKPLSPTDALQLLSRPLRYLGFKIDRYPHIETILTNTNYYPGILQFFGYNLVEALTTQYGNYYRAVDGNPPFTLQDEQLGAVMNDVDMNNSIRSKFRLSLELDPRYYMLARCVTVLYHLREDDSQNWLGFSVEAIKGIAEEYDIHCLEDLGKTEYEILLDEMVDMGILSKPEDKLYRLRRNSFVDIIGNDFDTLHNEIIEKNEEV